MGSDLGFHTEILANRLKKRAKHLAKWARNNDITCYRLYDRDIPEVPLVVDRYEGYLHVAEYHAPHKELPLPSEEYAVAMADVAGRALGVPTASVFVKTRRKTGRGEQYGRFSDRDVAAVVGEGGLRFEVNLSGYLDTGLFLDHRPTRALARDIVTEFRLVGRVRVLNLFSYTGSFTVYAASGGASETVSVDLSAPYCAWARRNLELNGFAPGSHRIENQDVFPYLADAARRRERFDLVVVDPPTFSNSKKMSRILDVQRDHGELLGACARILAADGVILFSTNRRDFRLADVPDRLAATDITASTIPPDFRNRRIHHCWLLAAADAPAGLSPAARGSSASCRPAGGARRPRSTRS